MPSAARILTEIKDGAASVGVKLQKGIARRALLRFELADIFVKAGFVSNMTTFKL